MASFDRGKSSKQELKRMAKSSIDPNGRFKDRGSYKDNVDHPNIVPVFSKFLLVFVALFLLGLLARLVP